MLFRLSRNWRCVIFFDETPFMDSPGAIVVVEKGLKDYSFSEISQIIESNEGKVWCFIGRF